MVIFFSECLVPVLDVFRVAILRSEGAQYFFGGSGSLGTLATLCGLLAEASEGPTPNGPYSDFGLPKFRQRPFEAGRAPVGLSVCVCLCLCLSVCLFSD
jgi:hypothetical protein